MSVGVIGCGRSVIVFRVMFAYDQCAIFIY